MNRLLPAAATLLLAALAANTRLHTPDPTVPPAPLAALLADPASPYRWADYAESIATTDPAAARRAFIRALDLAPGIPQIWVRYANFSFEQNDYPAAIRAAARVLAEVPDYDAALFHYFDAMDLTPTAILAEISSNPRAVRSWLDYSINATHPAAAALAWKRALAADRVPAPLAFSYVSFLVRQREWYGAIFSWGAWLGPRAGDYPQHNLLYNGDFQTNPTGGPLDWTLAPESDFFTITLADSAAHIHFAGQTNLDFNGLSHPVVFPLAGRYRLTARYKATGLTTNEGPRLAVPGLQKETDSLPNRADWTPISLDLFVSKPGIYPIAILRHPSQKFDNKIEGDFYLMSVSLKLVQ